MITITNKNTELDIGEMLSQLETNAWNSDGETTAYLVTKNDVVTLHGYTYEPSYEYFSTTHSIEFNNEWLFYKNSRNLGAYHNEAYTKGEFKTSEEAINYLEEYLRDKEVTLQYDYPEKTIILQMIDRNQSYADRFDSHSTYIKCDKNIIELKSEVMVTSHDREGYFVNFLFINNNCVVSYARTDKIYNYLIDYLKGKNYEIITDKNKVATLNAERNKAMENTTENKNKKELTFVDFSNQQMFNERTIKDKDGNDVTLVSVSLPSSAEHKGYYIDVQKQYVYPSRYNNKMSCVSYVKGQDVPIKHYDKETKTQDKIVLKAEDVKKEFSSWRNNKKEKSNTETAQEQYSQPAPEYASADVSDFTELAEQDFEPIEI